jgi:FKBP-type peptidyl-prolyl cis-trans isomerase FkpA
MRGILEPRKGTEMSGPNNPMARSSVRALEFALIGLLALGLSGIASARQTPKTEEEKTLYFLGVMASRTATDLSLSKAEAAMMMQGLQDAIDGKAIELDNTVYLPKLQALAKDRQEQLLAKEGAASKAFLEKAAKASGAKVTESGLIITEVKAGSGASPAPTDTVRVHYHGTLRDGTVFDSSVQRGEPLDFPLNRVIPCWTEGVGMMKVGGKAKLICPPEIAYGERGAPPTIPGGAALTFDVELLEIVSQ